jgi:wyosine [tRNA(Phe)-imidazoG37] synthetase (radical SAM superfamily)
MNLTPSGASGTAVTQPADAKDERKPKNGAPARDNHARDSFVSCPQDFLTNRFVYVMVSARARGLSVGVNMCPDKLCNFDCVYCEVNRRLPAAENRLDVEVMAGELEKTLHYVQSPRLHEHPVFGSVPRDLLHLRHVALSGHGEPTLCPNFVEAVQAVVHVRALGRVPFFKLVLVTNGSGLDSASVQAGLKYFSHNDEIWIKLDAGTQAYMDLINRPKVLLEKNLAVIQLIGRQRPVVIQSLFTAYKEAEPEPEEIEQFAQRLRELKGNGANISQVQIYSATRPFHNPDCRHLPLKSLSRIAQVVRCATGLPVEVF